MNTPGKRKLAARRPVAIASDSIHLGDIIIDVTASPESMHEQLKAITERAWDLHPNNPITQTISRLVH